MRRSVLEAYCNKWNLVLLVSDFLKFLKVLKFE